MDTQLPDLYVHQVGTADELRKILDPRMWGWVTQLLKTSRSYEAGLCGTKMLQARIDTFADQLHPEELQVFQHQAYALELVMLDKLDRLEEYLERWQWMRAHINSEIEYSCEGIYDRIDPDYLDEITSRSGVIADDLPVIRQTGTVPEDQIPFILRIGFDSVYLHWLYQHEDRRAVIARKLERKRKGKSLKADRHGTAADIPVEVMRQRIAQFAQAAEETMSRA